MWSDLFYTKAKIKNFIFELWRILLLRAKKWKKDVHILYKSMVK